MVQVLKTILLTPLSWLYGLVVFVRNELYDEHILPSHTVTVPTICVGNLAVGGTGKTPHVEYLLRLLKNRYTVAVLSRGYGRKTHGFVLADADSTALQIGDEMAQLHRKFPDVAMAVCADRVRGVRRLQQAVPGLQLVILDDAYQHRCLRCGFYLLLTPYDRLYVHDYLMPRGRLREPAYNSLRAHAIVVTKCPDTMRPIDKRVVDNSLRLPSFQQLYFSRIRYGELQLSGTPLILTGIAHPEYMVEHVRKTYPQAPHLNYADHHAFTPRELEAIERQAEPYSCVLTTEKDYARLSSLALSDTLRQKLTVLPIEIELPDDREAFERQINTYVLESVRRAGLTKKNNP